MEEDVLGGCLARILQQQSQSQPKISQRLREAIRFS